MTNEGKCSCGISCPGARYICVIAAAVLVLLGFYLFGLARNAWKNYSYIGKPADRVDVITISGEGKVTAKPDVAAITIGTITEKTTVAQAQKENTDKMNAIVSVLKNQFKIDANDIKTSEYSINPKYDWSSNVQRIVGYSVSQSVQVKVRNFDSIGDILAKAGELGSNSVSGPNFVIDKPETFREQARKEAIDQAKQKAKTLADQVGIKLGSIVNFSENSDGGIQPVMYDQAMRLEAGSVAKTVAPQIESGSQDVSVSVSISYEIK